MDMNLVRELVTVVSFVAFAGIVAYAVFPGNKERFDEAARLPLDEEDERQGAPSPVVEGKGGDPLPNPLPREREQTWDKVSRIGSIR